MAAAGFEPEKCYRRPDPVSQAACTRDGKGSQALLQDDRFESSIPSFKCGWSDSSFWKTDETRRERGRDWQLEAVLWKALPVRGDGYNYLRLRK
jgi:hypothetical protein